MEPWQMQESARPDIPEMPSPSVEDYLSDMFDEMREIHLVMSEIRDVLVDIRELINER